MRIHTKDTTKYTFSLVDKADNFFSKIYSPFVGMIAERAMYVAGNRVDYKKEDYKLYYIIFCSNSEEC